VRQRQHAAAQSVAAKEALQHAYDNLEQMVAGRTSELRETARNLSQEIDERRHAERELHKTQNELIQAGKMAVLGQMSASITHELNQPLTALRGMSDNALILLERGRLQEVQANLSGMSQIVERMGSITGQLKIFARKSTTCMTSVSIRHAIVNALFLVERRLRLEQVAFEQHIPDEDVYALCESNRLEQVLVNLFNNALDSMADCAVRRLTVDVVTQKERVLIRVHDTGSGISETVRQHLFEPFFTTKAPGHGLGLGLAISGQIVREFGGTLAAENCFENGAVFTIELRVSPQEVKYV
jgi:two-component system C4-dicarboxylate transport sensor histidine kinase DctB